MRTSLEGAEVSLVVRDDLHNLGIGTALLEFAGRKAYADGLDILVGVVQSTNHALWRSMRNLNVPVKRRRDGPHTIVEVDLREAEIFRWRPPHEPDDCPSS